MFQPWQYLSKGKLLDLLKEMNVAGVCQTQPLQRGAEQDCCYWLQATHWLWQWAMATTPIPSHLPTANRQERLTAPGPSFFKDLFIFPSLWNLPKVISPSSNLSNLGLGTSRDGDSKACPTPSDLHFRNSPRHRSWAGGSLQLCSVLACLESCYCPSKCVPSVYGFC